MNANLINAASQIIPNTPFLVNVMRLRVKQLQGGHRPLVVHPPGMGMADIALLEVIQGKLTYERQTGDSDSVVLPVVVPFQGPAPTKKAA